MKHAASFVARLSMGLAAGAVLVGCAAEPLPAPVAPALAPAPAPTPGGLPPASEGDRQAIAALVEAFRQGIITRDAARLAGLFLGDQVPFVAARDKEGVAKIHTMTARAFIDDVTRDPHRLEERFTEVEIRAAEGLGVMSSRYSFHEEGKQTNHGWEIWTLVRTQAGWKISLVTWSVVLD